MSGHVFFRAKGIKKSFGGVRALKGVDIVIKAGEIHCLAGENGCGKSTLIKIISGVYKADEGTLEIDGKEYNYITPVQAIKQGIQVIYQDLSIFPNLTVMENLALSMELQRGAKIVNYKNLRRIAEKAISYLNYNVDLNARVGNLSMGDKQMIAICRSLLFNAKLIIMDEPTSSLSKNEVQSLFKVIYKLKDSGIAILFVSHKLDEVFEISDKITIFRNGENVISTNAKEIDSDKFAFYMTGRTFDKKLFDVSATQGPPLLKVENLTKLNYYKNISFELRRGEILGITGLLGCGRDEIMLSLFGMLPHDSGNIYFDGKEVKLKSIADAKKLGIGYVPFDRISEGMFLSLPIKINILAAKLKQMVKRMNILDKKKILQEVNTWIKKISIVTENTDAAAGTLSGGNQQKVVLARWLATDLSLLILNGPTVGVDIGAKYDIHEILQNLAKQGLAIIIVSDDLPEILSNCSRIIIIKKGEIDGEYSPKDLNEIMLSNMITNVG